MDVAWGEEDVGREAGPEMGNALSVAMDIDRAIQPRDGETPAGHRQGCATTALGDGRTPDGRWWS